MAGVLKARTATGPDVWVDVATGVAFNQGDADARYVNVTGDVMTAGQLGFGSRLGQHLDLYANTYGIGIQSNNLYFRSSSGFQFHVGGTHDDADGSPGAGGVTAASIGSTGIYLPADPTHAWHACRKNYVDAQDGAKVSKTGDVMSGASAYLMIGKNPYDFNSSGVYMPGNGQVIVQTSIDSNPTNGRDTPSIRIERYGSGSLQPADAYGYYAMFVRHTAIQGSIAINASATGTLFNTTSHGPFKGNITDLDDDEALGRLKSWRPVAFQWKRDADGEISEDGEPSGDVEHGFIAQELHEVQPQAVSPGTGTDADHRAWRGRTAGQHDPDDPDPFVPWQVDFSKLVPDLVAAVQALTRQVEALVHRVVALEGGSGS